MAFYDFMCKSINGKLKFCCTRKFEPQIRLMLEKYILHGNAFIVSCILIGVIVLS